MKKIDISQTIQILANVGVIAGIVFLGVEIRQNNETLVIQARLAREAILRDSTTRRLDNIELARATVKARAGGTLSDDEEFLLNQLNGAIFVDRLLIYQQVQDGLLRPEEIPVETWRNALQEFPRMREAWAYHKRNFPPGFVQWYEENIFQPGPP
jgi:hypothetical protein